MAASNDYLIPEFPPTNFPDLKDKPKVCLELPDPYAFMKMFFSLFEELDYVLIENDMWVYYISTIIIDIVEFEVTIYTIPSGCLVEIRHMFGCRYTYSKVINTLGKKFGVDFNYGFINTVLPELQMSDIGNISPKERAIIDSLPKSDQVCLSFLNTHKVDQIISGIIMGVNHIIKKYNFDIANRIITVAEYSITLDDSKLLAIITRAIATIARLPDVPIEWIHQAEPVVRLLLEHDYDYPHVKRESQRALALILARL
jgi:hypothetical protein